MNDPVLIENESFLIKNASFLVKNDLFLIKSGLFLVKNGLFLIKNKAFLFKNDPFLIKNKPFFLPSCMVCYTMFTVFVASGLWLKEARATVDREWINTIILYPLLTINGFRPYNGNRLILREGSITNEQCPFG
jgi:hypothetical protein